MSKEDAGFLRISEDVITTITSAAISEIKGVEGLNSRGGLISGLFSSKKPISVKVAGDVVHINADIILKHGYNAVSVCEKIQEAVKSDVQAMTGIAVSRVNLMVSGVSFERK
ncbi:MAG: Asp23/Gls24 family envelope stress response protein [Oscillospiraceae bacterium]|nr:Asp23/Gls24 family envelope stress response protein [Oscillospiraceae bacterium]MBQ9982635.1 Asp23/Gls24 family envelope stress response protein [Oscillospiraceae bacterium]